MTTEQWLIFTTGMIIAAIISYAVAIAVGKWLDR